jgi:hypothetical protein
VFNQAAHQVDVVRMLVGRRVKRVRACTGAWDPATPDGGCLRALLTFETAPSPASYTAAMRTSTPTSSCGWIGESGAPKDATAYGAARRALEGDEAALKQARNFGGPTFATRRRRRRIQHFGLLIVSCERGDLRPLPEGVAIYATPNAVEPLAPPRTPRGEVIDEAVRRRIRGQGAAARRRVGDAHARRLPRDPALRTRAARGCLVKDWQRAIPKDRLAHVIKDATRALVRALSVRLATQGVSFGHWTFLRILWEHDGLTQRELSEMAGVMEPTTFSAIRAMEELGYVTPAPDARTIARTCTFISPRADAR